MTKLTRADVPPVDVNLRGDSAERLDLVVALTIKRAVQYRIPQLCCRVEDRYRVRRKVWLSAS